jgi:hypothetical protein
MNLIELHIIQSFPVSCLNRDDVGAPKSAYFGGCQRARVSSQSWKRAIREMAKGIDTSAFGGNRGHYQAKELASIRPEMLVQQYLPLETVLDHREAAMFRCSIRASACHWAG